MLNNKPSFLRVGKKADRIDLCASSLADFVSKNSLDEQL